MSMTANGSVTENTDKEYSRTHQLEELKEDFIKTIKSKKSLKSFKRVNEHNHSGIPAISQYGA